MNLTERRIPAVHTLREGADWVQFPALRIESFGFKTTEIKKNKVAKITINGPAGKPVILKNKIPKKALRAPNNKPKRENWNKFLLKFRDVAAGIATKAAVKSPPTIFAPKATIMAIAIK